MGIPGESTIGTAIGDVVKGVWNFLSGPHYPGGSGKGSVGGNEPRPRRIELREPSPFYGGNKRGRSQAATPAETGHAGPPTPLPAAPSLAFRAVFASPASAAKRPM